MDKKILREFTYGMYLIGANDDKFSNTSYQIIDNGPVLNNSCGYEIEIDELPDDFICP